ncbi:hypothetical protein McpCs1_03700 [Methanocorpusculaceae archaeon Cs1]|uniref:Uncharacterized protein n=1 Tax=Methanorbis rubei TaxID=3028300 RepID=A0AAE4MER4_9EURY|nr:hypothetical protein [Methanocorpusculaceae archaeon Cs1]
MGERILMFGKAVVTTVFAKSAIVVMRDGMQNPFSSRLRLRIVSASLFTGKIIHAFVGSAFCSRKYFAKKSSGMVFGKP